MKLINNTHYSDSDLRRFLKRGLRAMGVRDLHSKVIKVNYSNVKANPSWVGGLALIGSRRYGVEGEKLYFTVPRLDANLDLAELARVIEHEAAHSLGLQHEEMKKDLEYSKGKKPKWSRRLKMRGKK